VGEQVEGHHRVGGPALDPDEGAEQDGADRRRRPERGGPRAAGAEPPEQQAYAQGQRADVHDPQTAPGAALGPLPKPPDEGGRDQADRQVDEEDPPPADGGDEPGAGQGAEHGRHPPHGAEEAHHPGTLGEGEEVAHHGLSDGLEAAGADALERAEEDERAHAGRGRAEDRGDHEDGEPGEQHHLAAVQVGEPSPDRDRGRPRQQVAGEDPGIQGELAELAGDGRERGPDHAGVDGGDERRQHEARHDADEPGGPRDPVRLGVARGRRQVLAH
jgi:hypothetical protein